MIFKAVWHVIQSDRWGFPWVLRFPPTESTQTQTSVPINKVKIKLCLMFILFIIPCFLVYRIHNGLSEMLEMTLVSLEEFHWIWQILNNYSSNSCNETLWTVHQSGIKVHVSWDKHLHIHTGTMNRVFIAKSIYTMLWQKFR